MNFLSMDIIHSCINELKSESCKNCQNSI